MTDEAICPTCNHASISANRAAIRSLLGMKTSCPICGNKCRHSSLIVNALNVFCALVLFAIVMVGNIQDFTPQTMLVLVTAAAILFFLDVIVLKKTRLKKASILENLVVIILVAIMAMVFFLSG